MSVTFAWSEFVTDDLAAMIRDAAGVSGPLDVPTREAVADVLESLGYLPVIAQWPADADRTRIAGALLCQAFGRVLSAAGVRVVADGAIRQASADVRIDRELVPHTLVDVNVADAATLESLPVLGTALAARIVADRRAGGAYTSMDDLVARVPGLGTQAAPALRDVVSFASAIAAEGAIAASSVSVAAMLERVLRQVRRPTPAAALFAALRMTAVTCRSPRLVPPDAPVPIAAETVSPPSYDAELVVPLANARYYYGLLELIGEATSSVSVAMFHAALPEAGHPTRQILDALVGAHRRGATVRVLLDRDRASDPFLSSTINSPAYDFLTAAGVATRRDADDTLLHSKLVVVDRRIVVIGSHNWSAGSYFQFDDLSVAVTSATYGAVMEARFDALWTAAGP